MKNKKFYSANKRKARLEQAMHLPPVTRALKARAPNARKRPIGSLTFADFEREHDPIETDDDLDAGLRLSTLNLEQIGQ